MNRHLEQHDVERIVRDVATELGFPVSRVLVEQTDAGWRISLTDARARVIAHEVHAGSPAAVRATVGRWLDDQW